MFILKKLFYFMLVIIFPISMMLTVFELILYTFHESNATWTYLLHQQYISFIDLDIYDIHAKRHLLDVKRVLEFTYNIWLILLSFSILGMVFCRNNYKKIIKKGTVIGVILSILLLLSSISFLSSFELLHHFLFNQNTWIFSNDSYLIELFPLIYFQQFFFIFLTLSMLLFLLSYFLTFK